MHKIFYFKNLMLPVLILILGLLFFCYPMIVSNGNAMPGDLGDVRFINYVLEHGWLFINQHELHTEFWTLPFFYPNTHTLAYSDIMLGGMLLYVPIRFFIDSPQTSLQIWFIVCCILNYVSFYLLMRKCFKFNPLSCSIAAFLFGFGLPRQNQICHLQLFTQFFMIFSILSFLQIDKYKTRLRNNICFLIGTLLFLLQIYTSFYLGWFIILSFVIIIGICFYSSSLRPKLYEFLKFYKFELLTYTTLFLILILPLVYNYFSVGAQWGWEHKRLMNIYGILSSKSYIDNLIFKFQKLPVGENTIGLGLFTSLGVLTGLMYKNKYKKYMLVFIAIVLCIFCLKFPNLIIYKCIMGNSAIRAGGRIVFLLLVVYAYGIANLLQHINNKFLLRLVVFIILFEQFAIPDAFRWTKSEHSQRLLNYDNIQDTCKIIYYKVPDIETYKYLNDLIWVAHYKNAYLVNGYSGYMPSPNPDGVPTDCIYTFK